jgi:hypothetical protein
MGMHRVPASYGVDVEAARVAARFFLKFLSNLVLSLNDRFDKGKDHK